VELKAGDPVALPAGVVLYARDGLWEGAGGNLHRSYVDASGALRTDDLFVSHHGAEPRALLGAFAGENGALWARICHGTCYGGSEPVTTRRSHDGGITWTDVFESDNQGPYVIGQDGDDLILAERNPNQEFFLIRKTPSANIRIDLPASVSAQAQVFAARTASGLLLAAFARDERSVWDVTTGQRIVMIPVPNPFQFLAVEGFQPGGGGRELAVNWLGSGTPSDADWYVGVLDIASGAFSRVIRGNQADGVAGLHALQWITETKAIGRANLDAARYLPGQTTEFGSVPALIDLEAGTVRPIEGFVELLGAKVGGPVPIRVDLGTFARVSTNGECLNVRAAANTSAAVLECFPDGVFLEVRANASEGWLPVRTPDGRDGWAATDFLETFGP